MNRSTCRCGHREHRSLWPAVYSFAFTATFTFGLVFGQWTLFLLTLSSPFVICLAGYMFGPGTDCNTHA